MSFQSQFNTYTKYGVPFVSCNMIDVRLDISTNRIKKDIDKHPTTYQHNKGITTKYDSTCNSCYIPLGFKPHLILVDVDNKNGTLKKWWDIVTNNNININTLTTITINNGLHYLYRTTPEQEKLLDKFKSADGKVFQGCDIDIKYNYAHAYGATEVDFNGIKLTYKITRRTSVATLPDFIFNKIISYIDSTKVKKTKKTKEQILDPQLIQYTTNKQLKLYLDYLKSINDKLNRNDWLIIGSTIYKLTNDFNIFDDFSQSSKHYNKSGCKDTWNGFNNSTFGSIDILISIIERINPKAIYDLFKLDGDRTLNKMYETKVYNDQQFAYFFYSQYPKDFLYDLDNKLWYSITQYGTYIKEIGFNSTLTQLLQNQIQRLIEKNAIDRRDQISEKIANLKPDEKHKEPELEESLNYIIKLSNTLINYLSCHRNKKQIIEELESLYGKRNIYKLMNAANPYLVGFNNGVYDVQNNEHRHAKPEEYITLSTGYDYKEPTKEATERIMNVLKDIFPDEEELKYLINTLSFSTIGGNVVEEFYIWIGTGQNGKGVLSHMLHKTLGSYSASLNIDYLTKGSVKQSPNSADSILASKQYKRLVVSTEPEKDATLLESKIKELTGGDEVDTRQLHCISANMIIEFSLIIQTNGKPNIDGGDGGIKRRLRLLRFPNSFVDHEPILENERKKDLTLKKTFTDSVDLKLAFFHILITYLPQLIKNNFKFDMPPRFKQDTAEFMKENDPLGAFIKECIKTGIVNNNESLKDIHSTYIDYCEASGYDKKSSNKALKSALISKGFNVKSEHNAIYFTNIKLERIKQEEPNKYGNYFRNNIASIENVD